MAAPQPASTALKALAAIDFLAQERNGAGLSQLARSLKSTHSSTLRILAALERGGLVTKSPTTKRYRLTLRLVELGTRVLDQLELPELARPHLDELCRASGETVHLGVLDGWDVVFVAKAEPPDPIRLHSRVGVRAPSHCTSIGKAILSTRPPDALREYLASYTFKPLLERTIASPLAFAEHLALVRAQGYAVDDEEHRAGICCVGAPVVGLAGEALAGVSVAGPAFRLREPERLQTLARLVQATARAISAELGA